MIVQIAKNMIAKQKSAAGCWFVFIQLGKVALFTFFQSLIVNEVKVLKISLFASLSLYVCKCSVSGLS